MDERTAVIEAFTEMAPGYEETVDQELRLFWGVGYQEFIDRFLAMIDVNEGDVVLDIATGTGVIPRSLAPRMKGDGKIVGLDITPEMLSNARDKLRRLGVDGSIHLVCGSGMEMPLETDSFDVAICGLGTHHMNVPLLASEVKRVLKPGGRFIMADVRATDFWRTLPGRLLLRGLLLSYNWLVRRAERSGDGEINAYGLKMTRTRAQAELEAFNNVRTTGEWRTLLESLGFSSIETEEFAALRRIYPGGLILKAVVGSP
ncbi:MAG: methyltransferase domain-containing protein [Chloroflexi bacterium]|nr:methyltransferase domain-containing protein [Chloroflexota bacterium]